MKITIEIDNPSARQQILLAELLGGVAPKQETPKTDKASLKKLPPANEDEFEAKDGIEDTPPAPSMALLKEEIDKKVALKKHDDLRAIFKKHGIKGASETTDENRGVIYKAIKAIK